MSRIVVGLSGGVDSAVAALLLKQAGHQVTAVFMKNWDEDDDAGYCPAEADLADAREVCDIIDVELKTVSFSPEYWYRVFTQFLEEYRAGRTPNPDIVCNREIKFRAFLDYCFDLGADAIATGHYARLGRNAHFRLLRGMDISKDQTYFLHTLDQSQLARTRFPIGHLEKQRVREIAEQNGFPNHAKKDSTGICFIGERKFSDFLAQYLPKQPGEIRTLDDEVVGMHQGLVFYTLGQRQGLGIGGQKDTTGAPWYVARKEPGTNVAMPLSCTARIRHRQEDRPCTVTAGHNDECLVEFRQPQRAVTPGQSVVFYDGEECLGGGIIERST
jgi:tRNA-specific 2-thiouridylase